VGEEVVQSSSLPHNPRLLQPLDVQSVDLTQPAELVIGNTMTKGGVTLMRHLGCRVSNLDFWLQGLA
jgi:hypothetical protein